MIDSVVCDEMIDPLVDQRPNQQGIRVFRPAPSDSDDEVLELAKKHRCPVITRDRDFVDKHREGSNSYGIIFDPGMHHRPSREILPALNSVFELMDAEDLKNTVVRLKRFY